MAAEVPEPGMAAEIPELGMVALCIAVGCAEILRPVLDFLSGASARTPMLDAAAAAVVLTIPMAYLTGVIFLHLHVAPAAVGWFAVLVSALLLFMVFLFFIAGGVP